MSTHQPKPHRAKLRPGDLVWVQDDKVRPAIVIRVYPPNTEVEAVRDFNVMVVTGTGVSKPGMSRTAACPTSPEGQHLGLEKQTFFYPSGLLPIEESSVKRRTGKSARQRWFLRIESYATEQLADLLQMGDVDHVCTCKHCSTQP